MFCILHLGPWSILSKFLCKVLGKCLDLFFCIWIFSCWKHFFSIELLMHFYFKKISWLPLSESVSELSVWFSWFICLFFVNIMIFFFELFNYSSSSVLCWLYGVFCLFIWSLDQFIAIYKIVCWNFDWACIDSMNQLRRIVILIFSFPIHEHGILIHVHLWFLSSVFCSFPHTNFIHILLALFLGISFWQCYKWY